MATTKCGWCGAVAHMSGFGATWRVPVANMPEFTLVSGAVRCDNCSRILVASTMVRETHSYAQEVNVLGSFWDHQSTVLISPSYVEGQDFPDVPTHIAAAASEAHKSASIGNRMSAILMARTVIEATAKDKGITKGTLQGKIEKMLEQRLVRDHIKESADEIRHFGNDMAHGDITEPVDDDDVSEVLALMDEVLNEVYQSHARLAKVREKRLAKKSGTEA